MLTPGLPILASSASQISHEGFGFSGDVYTVRMSGTPWWENAVGYEIYIRSFSDGNGDGVGDLIGIEERLHYLADLGIDAIWISPFYTSPMADFGYDVADYRDIDPAFGTLADFDKLIEVAHRLGLKVIVDIVPNHCSDQHPWFLEALSDPTSAKRDWFHWRDPAPDGGPPNNWASHFGGPSWTLDEASGQYYLHLFLPEQPDLNWDNPEVRAEFLDILRFWCERGVDGFRIDVAHGLAKNPALPDLPVVHELTGDEGPRERFLSLDHVHDMNQEGVFDIYAEWRELADSYDAMLLGEVYIRAGDAARVAAYAGPGRLHRAFFFDPMHVKWSAESLWACFAPGAEASSEGQIGWAVSSHDDPRAPTRFGGGQVGKERSLAFTVLLTMLPGLPFLYQGSELGMEDVPVDPADFQDPVAIRNDNPTDGRDPCRTPIPWSDAPGFGFTAEGVKPWLPFGNHHLSETVKGQLGDPFSSLERHRRLLAVRRELGAMADQTLEWLTAPPEDVLAFRRGSVVVAINVGDKPAKLTISGGPWAVKYATRTERTSEWFDTEIEIHPDEALILVPNS